MMKKMLIVGYGDIARRALHRFAPDYVVHALSRHPSAQNDGTVSLQADLDVPASLEVLSQPWDAVLHLAPPGATSDRDERTHHLIEALKAAKILPRKLLYISTSGVYGDCQGRWIDETQPLSPLSDRAKRRVDAERQLRAWNPGSVILRVPGIYAADRLPLERLKRGTPVLRNDEDVYTNHIHAEDLAAICALALERALPGTIYNVSDDSEIKMGDWFDLVADRHGLPRPPRISRQEATSAIPAPLLSFMNESRRLVNTRMKMELGVRLLYPTIHQGVPEMRDI